MTTALAMALVLTAAPFTVTGQMPINAGIDADQAARFAESKAWRTASIRCTEAPLRVSEPKIVKSATVVSCAIDFSCPGGWPDLKAHVIQAEQIVRAKVTQIAPVPDGGKISEHSPVWFAATLQVVEPLKGPATAGSKLVVQFASSMDLSWSQAPKLIVGQESIFVLHPNENKTLAVTEPLDVHPIDHNDVLFELIHSK